MAGHRNTHVLQNYVTQEGRDHVATGAHTVSTATELDPAIRGERDRVSRTQIQGHPGWVLLVALMLAGFVIYAKVILKYVATIEPAHAVEMAVCP